MSAIRPPTRALLRSVVALALAGVVIVGLLLGPVPRLLDNPRFIDRLTIVNPTAYDLSIDAAGAERDGWVSVGIVKKRSTTAAEDVIDQGAVWFFRIAGQGHDGGEVRVTRGELERAKWTFHIPDSVGDELRARGAPPSP